MPFTRSFKNLFVGMAFILLLGCAPVSEFNYQVISVKSPVFKEANNSMIYENEDLRLQYDLWGDLGRLKYSVYNKRDEILYLDLKRSFFIKNGVAHDYYVNKTRTVSEGVSSEGRRVTITDQGAKGATYSETTKKELAIENKKTIAIPPKSSKEVFYFNLKNNLFSYCELEDYPEWEDTTQVTFNGSNTPLSFENYLTYSLDNDLKNPKKVSNEFWVHRIENMDGANFTKEIEKVEPCDSTETYEVEVTPHKASNRFYIEYPDDPYY